MSEHGSVQQQQPAGAPAALAEQVKKALSLVLQLCELTVARRCHRMTSLTQHRPHTICGEGVDLEEGLK